METYEAVEEWGRRKLIAAYPKARNKWKSVDVVIESIDEGGYGCGCDLYSYACITVSCTYKYRVEIDKDSVPLADFVDQINAIKEGA